MKILKKNSKLSNAHTIEIFKKIWGIGTIKAKMLLKEDIHSINDLKKAIKNGKIKLTEQQSIGLKYYEDINKRIPRNEITLYTKFIKNIFKDINYLEIYNAGSYRMGKKDSGDIDIIITYDNKNMDIKKIDEMVYNRLKDEIIKEILSRGIEKNIYIVKLPKTKIYRQMDIAIIDKKYLPWYLLYFGSSEGFSKKIRIEASKKGYKLNDKGIYNKKTGKRIDFDPKDERDIFKYLGLEYIKPEDRG